MINKELLREFSAFLEEKMGLGLSKKSSADIEKKMVDIARSLDFENTASCIKWLMTGQLNQKELAVLTFHLTVGETYFFRNEGLFTALEKHIFPSIIKAHKKDQNMRIWSAGCCTGEEPYSLAILLHRLLPDLNDWNINLVGTDINREFLSKAEKGIYKKWSFRTLPQEIKNKYFIKNKDGSYTIIPEIQKMVKFSYLNLVEDNYPDPIQGTYEMDLILCHNVLIYFSDKQIKKTIHQLTKTLGEHGMLSVAPIETPFVAEKHLIPQRYDRTTYFIKDSTNTKDHHEIPKFHPKIENKVIPLKKFENKYNKMTERNPVQGNPGKGGTALNFASQGLGINKDELYAECVQLFQKKHYNEVISKLELLLLSFSKDSKVLSEHLKEVLLLSNTYANKGDLTDGLKWCENALQIDKLNPHTHYLHATLLQAQGKIPEAIKALKSAIFNDSNFIMAHYLLGLLERQQGKENVARRHFKNALELIELHPPEGELPGMEDYTFKHLKDLIINNLKDYS